VETIKEIALLVKHGIGLAAPTVVVVCVGMFLFTVLIMVLWAFVGEEEN